VAHGPVQRRPVLQTARSIHHACTAEVCTMRRTRWLARACYLQSYGTCVVLEQRDRSSLSLWHGDWGPLDRVSLPADKAYM
jgi:hypothetical protein